MSTRYIYGMKAKTYKEYIICQLKEYNFLVIL